MSNCRGKNPIEEEEGDQSSYSGEKVEHEKCGGLEQAEVRTEGEVDRRRRRKRVAEEGDCRGKRNLIPAVGNPEGHHPSCDDESDGDGRDDQRGTP